MMGERGELYMAFLIFFFFHEAGKWDTGMKVKAELGKELRASPGMTRLM